MAETTRKLNGKVAIVTGAASGIGAAAARQFHSDGGRVIAVDMQPLDMDGDDRLVTLVQDVSATGAAERIRNAAITAFGQIDILLNNAGICVPAPIEDHPDHLWRRTMAINVDACFALSSACISPLKKSDAGRIINVGSVMSDVSGPGMAAYAASKHAVAGITKTLANELGPFGITANYIQPGAIRTGITVPAFDNQPGFEDYWINKAPIGRIGVPEDVIPLISFLASEESRFVNGQGILVDGGAMSHA